MEAAQWKAAETARRLELSRSAVSQILSGKNKPSPQVLELLRMKVLALKEEEPRGEGPVRPEPMITKDAPRRGYGSGPYWGTTDFAPIVSAVSAGTAHAWEDAGHSAPRILVNCKDPNCYAVEVWGDSMEPIYHPGDILVIAPNAQVNANDLVIFKTTEDEPYFKKYLGEKKGMHRFASLNLNYPVMELKPREIRKMHPVHSIIRPLKGKIF